MKKDRSLIITILIILTIITITIIISFAIIKTKMDTKEESNKVEEKIDLLNYKLTKEMQTLNVDEHLKINFIGNKINDLYKYTLEMYLDNNKLNNNTFFEDTTKDIVYSYAYAYFVNHLQYIE